MPMSFEVIGSTDSFRPHIFGLCFILGHIQKSTLEIGRSMMLNLCLLTILCSVAFTAEDRSWTFVMSLVFLEQKHRKVGRPVV